MDKIIDIIEEPSGKVYSDLIEFGQKNCFSFSLMWPKEVSLNKINELAKELLMPYYIEEKNTDNWPGTKIMGGKRLIRYYKFSENSAIFLKSVSSLYQWKYPDYPEDLAFYVKNRECWLGSIAHERDSFFYANIFPLEKITDEIPGLKIKP